MLFRSSTIGLPIILVGLFYFMMIRPQQRRAKEHVAQIAKQLGDEITIQRFVRFQVGEAAA